MTPGIDFFVPTNPDRLQIVNLRYPLGAAWTSGVPCVVLWGRNQGTSSLATTTLDVSLKPSPEWWFDLTVELKAGADFWFSGVNIWIVRPMPKVRVYDWEIVHSGISVGGMPVQLPKSAFFPYGPGAIILYHEAAGYSGAATNEVHIGGCYYAL